jgi:hypothetical protein
LIKKFFIETALLLRFMRHLYYLLLFPLLFAACEGYKDPAPFTDPRIINNYCNIPSAINYNWNFPGIPNDSVCVFPAQIYQGNYRFYDSVFNTTGLLLEEDTLDLTFTQLDTTRLLINGFCAGLTLKATANRFFKFTLDSLAGNGQLFCTSTDTLLGGGSKTDLSDTLKMQLSFELITPTGTFLHTGTAIKQ